MRRLAGTSLITSLIWMRRAAARHQALGSRQLTSSQAQRTCKGARSDTQDLSRIRLMGTLFDPRDRAAILDRIGRLTEDRRPLWGRFTASQMVCHVSSGLRNGLDEADLGPPRGALTHWPINWLVIHVVPFPKGAKAAPEMLAT